jgi:hypothetical protein
LFTVQWNGKTAIFFSLNETDEKKAMQALLLKHPMQFMWSAFAMSKALPRQVAANLARK